MAERVRTTISVDPEVLELFRRMSELSGVSVSRCMGDWLFDTKDGAEHVYTKLAQVRQASTGVLRDLHIRLNVTELLDFMPTQGVDQAPARPPAAAARTDVPAPGQRPGTAPSSNTGLKSKRVAKNSSGKL